MPKRQILDTLQPRGKQYNHREPCASAENMRNPSIHVTLDVHTATKKYWDTKFYAQTSEATPQYHKKGKGAKQHNTAVQKKTSLVPHGKKYYVLPLLYLRRADALIRSLKASLLPLVQARAKDGKYPLHESRRRLVARPAHCFQCVVCWGVCELVFCVFCSCGLQMLTCFFVFYWLLVHIFAINE